MLSRATHRVLDAPAGYVRVRGFDRLQQEQMILQFVSAHGHISRSQAIELCSLTPDQASRMLRRLAAALQQKESWNGTANGKHEYARPCHPR